MKGATCFRNVDNFCVSDQTSATAHSQAFRAVNIVHVRCNAGPQESPVIFLVFIGGIMCMCTAVKVWWLEKGH